MRGEFFATKIYIILVLKQFSLPVVKETKLRSQLETSRRFYIIVIVIVV